MHVLYALEKKKSNSGACVACPCYSCVNCTVQCRVFVCLFSVWYTYSKGSYRGYKTKQRDRERQPFLQFGNYRNAFGITIPTFTQSSTDSLIKYWSTTPRLYTDWTAAWRFLGCPAEGTQPRLAPHLVRAGGG